MGSFKELLFSCGIAGLIAGTAEAKLNVLTTTTNGADLVKSVGKDLVDVESITKGNQDPHFIEAKPSFMISASKTDLLVSEGLELEIGWLPAVLKGARNAKVMSGADGSLELGKFIQPLEVPQGVVSRDQGDVHPDGNPHFMLDPIRVADMAVVVADRLAKLDPTNADAYRKNGLAFKAKLLERVVGWKVRIKATGIKDVIAYHKTLTYFFDAFSLTQAGSLEPKPGVPPTANHIMELISLVQTKKIPLILVENFFDAAPADKIKQSVPNIKILSVAVGVGGAKNVTSLEQLFESLVSAVEGKNVSISN
jgi:zinc/manganese transport system substrate-binding protein